MTGCGCTRWPGVQGFAPYMQRPCEGSAPHRRQALGSPLYHGRRTVADVEWQRQLFRLASIRQRDEIVKDLARGARTCGPMRDELILRARRRQFGSCPVLVVRRSKRVRRVWPRQCGSRSGQANTALLEHSLVLRHVLRAHCGHDTCMWGEPAKQPSNVRLDAARHAMQARQRGVETRGRCMLHEACCRRDSMALRTGQTETMSASGVLQGGTGSSIVVEGTAGDVQLLAEHKTQAGAAWPHVRRREFWQRCRLRQAQRPLHVQTWRMHHQASELPRVSCLQYKQACRQRAHRLAPNEERHITLVHVRHDCVKIAQLGRASRHVTRITQTCRLHAGTSAAIV
eukprot:363142-Chlamydomonas_euryale.AAC.8